MVNARGDGRSIDGQKTFVGDTSQTKKKKQFWANILKKKIYVELGIKDITRLVF